MKALFHLATSIFVLLFLSGCDKFEEKKFSTTIEVRIPVDVTSENNGAVVIDMNQLADVLAMNSNLAQVQDKIKRYELVGIKYKVFEYWNSPTSTFSGALGFANKNMENPGLDYALTNLSLQQSMDATELTRIDFSNNDLEKIQQYFIDTNALKIFLRGEISETPSKFTLYLQVDVDAIAEVEK